MKRFATILFALLLAAGAAAQTKKPQNRPYIDLRRWHYGFSVGMHVQDFEMVNTGAVTSDGQVWFADVPGYSPGFSVGVLGELYLHRYVSLRFVPQLHFGEKRVLFREQATGEEYSQVMKSAQLAVSVNVKYAAERFNNYRPYVMAGVNPMINLSGGDQDYVRLKRYDTFIEVGLGCDLYLKYFKLIPELKFCYSHSDALDKGHADRLQDPNMRAYAKSVSAGHSKMFVLTFYFE